MIKGPDPFTAQSAPESGSARVVSSVEQLRSAPRPMDADDGERSSPYFGSDAPMGRSHTPPRTAALTTSHAEGASKKLLGALETIERALAEARDAGEQIEVDAGSLRHMFDGRDPASAETRVAELERQLADERARFDAEREYLINQQDKFVAQLIEEHEIALAEAARERDAVIAQVKRLQHELGQPKASPTEPSMQRPRLDVGIEQLRMELEAARTTIDKMTAERERSLDMLRRVHAQRDASQRELAQLRRKQFATETPTLAPPAPEVAAVAAESRADALRAQDRRPTDPAPPPYSVEPVRRTPLVLSDLDAAWDRETYPAPPPRMDPNEPPAAPAAVEAPISSDPRGLGATLRHSPPPIELSAAVLGVPPSSDRRNSSQPVRTKPALHQRPLIGYSVRPGSSETELLEGARLSSSKPPR